MDSNSPYEVSIYEDQQLFYPSDNTLALPDNIGEELYHGGMSLYNPAKRCGNLMYYLSDEKHKPIAPYLFGNETDIKSYCKRNGLKVVYSGSGTYKSIASQYNMKTMKDIKQEIKERLEFKASLKAMSDSITHSLDAVAEQRKQVKETRENALKLKECAEDTTNKLTEEERSKMLASATDTIQKIDSIRLRAMGMLG